MPRATLLILKSLLTLALLLPAACKDGQIVNPTANFQDPSPSLQPQEPPDTRPAGPQLQRIVQPVDPAVIFRPTVNLSILQLSVPAGLVSRNDAFWKRLQEDAIEVSAYDVLQKNGLRVGLADFAELETIIKALGSTPIDSRPLTYIASGVKVVELPMKQGLPYQLIYDFDLRNVMTLRSYDDAENLFVLKFQPIPRRPGEVRIDLCPMVRSLRKRPMPVGNEIREIEFRAAEKLFDLRLSANLPLEKFLLIGPSPEARAPMSLGHAFLITEGPTEERETVLLILPQPLAPKPDSQPHTQP